jgi:thymidylate synthase
MKYKHEDGTPFTKEEFLQKLKTNKEFNNEFGNKGIDQIANVINLLKTDPDSRRMIVNAWNVGELDQMVLPPCHMMFQFYTRELSLEERHQISLSRIGHDGIADMDNISWHETYNKTRIPTRAISLMYYARSQDVPLGTPFNISSYSLLLMIIAKHVNMVPEELIANMGDCHIYNNQIEGIKEQLTRVPYDLPTVRISDRVVNDISEYEIDDFVLENYQYHPSIKLPLSN